MKPELPADKKLATISREARYTFVLTWTIADDDGLFRAEPRQLIGELYPHDPDVTETMLGTWLSELVKLGAIRWRSTKDGSRVGEIVNWEKHQAIKNRSKPFLANELAPPSVESTEELTPVSVEPTKMPDVEPRAQSLEPRVLSPKDTAPSRALVPFSEPGGVLYAKREATLHFQETKRKLDAQARLVFEYFRAAFGKRDSYLYCEDHRKRLVRRLTENGGDVSELFYAIDGAKKDDWIMGRAKGSKGYKTIDTVLRDREQVNKFLENVEPNGQHPAYREMLERHEAEVV